MHITVGVICRNEVITTVLSLFALKKNYRAWKFRRIGINTRMFKTSGPGGDPKLNSSSVIV